MPSAEQVGRHLMREARVAEHDRDDRMLAGPDREAGLGHGAPEPAGVGREPVAQRAGRPRAARGRRARRTTRAGASVFEKRYGRERWRSSSTISRRAGREAAAGAAERLAEGRGDDVDAADDPAVLGRAAAGRAEEAGGVAVVHHHQRVVPLGQVADLVERRDVAVHGEDAVGGDQARARVPACPASMRSRSAMSPWA